MASRRDAIDRRARVNRIRDRVARSPLFRDGPVRLAGWTAVCRILADGGEEGNRFVNRRPAPWWTSSGVTGRGAGGPSEGGPTGRRGIASLPTRRKTL